MSAPTDPQAALRHFPRSKGFFVAIDSDGCAFDTMEVKHKECFIPQIIRSFELAAVSRVAREVAEFVNLYSRYRGINRFPGLTLVLDLLAERPEVARRGVRIPPVPGLRAWLARASELSNPALRAEVELTDDPDLVASLEWSESVNAAIAAIVRNVPPFPFVRESLEKLDDHADVIVSSSTPAEALVREWHEHRLDRHVALIAGQEMGTKADHLRQAGHAYDRDKALMIGDAPGDLAAARSAGMLFYPIQPGDEDESWRRFHDEALPKFFAGDYAGAYMDERVGRFETSLAVDPPWKSGGN